MNEHGIEELIGTLYEMVQDARSVPFSSDKCAVEREKVLDLLDEISNQLPGELKQAKTIVDSRSELITNAKREAENIMKSAQAPARQLVSQEAIYLEAKNQANDMVRAAQDKIKELKKVTNDYVDDSLRRTEEAVAEALSEIRNSRSKFRALVNPQAKNNSAIIESFGSRIHGRFPVHDIVDPETGEVLIPNNRMMHEDDAKMLEAHGIHSVYARTVLGCRARSGVCAKCYGMNLATSELVNLGEAVGIIAAQSIGEPGTQLTMRTFHTGGVAGDDITQGLPRVEELFEARKPKKMAAIAEIDGVVEIDESHRSALRDITITADDGEVKLYQVPYSVGLKVEQGKRVRKGEPITDGALNPHDVLRISGVEAVQEYLTQGVLAVYRQQGVDINDKHIEVIIRQMMRKVRVEDPGDTTLLSGTVVDVYEFEDANAVVQARIDAGETDLRLATDSLILMGITKASLATESFLSAASFQETTKVLTEAAIKGKVDHLVGLKENVIIGKLIPAGSGLDIYRDFEPTNWPESSVTQSMIDNEQK